MRGAVHYDDTARGVMFHMAKLLINIVKRRSKKLKLRGIIRNRLTKSSHLSEAGPMARPGKAS